jgi:hypothetical protein
MAKQQDPRLERLVQFDDRSKQFRAVEGLEEKPLRSYSWSCDVVLDQGREGACVGFAWTHELAARPHVYSPVSNDLAMNGYKRARQLDEYPGEDYSGTSVLAGIKAFSELLNDDGLPVYGQYRWAFGTEDVLRVAGYKGPLVLGINWYYNMYTPDAKNFIHASGEVVGGHAILLNGVKIVKKPGITYAYHLADIDMDKSYVKLHNSWGADFGINGECYVTVRDLDKLLKDDGEACIPIVRRS